MPRKSRAPAIQLALESARNADNWITSESQFQECVAKLLDALGLLWFHPANERKCTPRQGARLKRAGVKSGICDVLIFNPFKDSQSPTESCSGCAIELKYGKNKPTPNQLEWLHQLSRNGWYADIAYSMADVIAILEECGYITGMGE